MTDGELSRLLALVADDLERRGYPAAGLVRTASRRLLELAFAQPRQRPGCARCGAAVEQPPRGRPRKFCLRCSPRRIAEKGKLGT